MLRKGFIIIWSLCCYSCLAGNDNQPLGGRSAALGTSYAALEDFWSAQNNQAALIHFRKPELGVYYENRFLINELSLKSLAVVLPFPNASLGINYSYFGYALLNQTKLGAAIAMNLGKKVSAGIQLDWLGLNLAETYGSKNALSFEIGLLCQITDHLKGGFHISNPFQVRLARYSDESFPSLCNFGLAYDFMKQTTICGEIEKNLRESYEVKLGLESHLMSHILLRLGVTTHTSLICMGLGYQIGNVSLDFSGSIHQMLGFSPRFSACYRFK